MRADDGVKGTRATTACATDADSRRAALRSNWAALEPIIDDVLDAPPDNRRELLLLRCADDRMLYDAALGWLNACEQDDGLLCERPLEPLMMAPPKPGAQIGLWRLLEEIGRGGMGIVYLAKRADADVPLRAALKFMHRAIAFDDVGMRRFRDERRILAALEHPSIARLLDGGVDDGLPWFAMEYVRGAPIDLWCDERTLDIDARIRLFCRVCEAVQHAHARLVVHRDLKPANILVSEAGDPKLLDFGIARLLADANAADRLRTRPGAQPMTESYAAPEQRRGDPTSTAVDVYSLGVLLHELLVGELPTADGQLAGIWARRRSRGAISSAHDDDEQTADAATIACARGTTPGKLRRTLMWELDRIVACAMHADPARRYRSADALAHDLGRYLSGRPVLARSDSAAYRVRKFIARHPLGSCLGVASAAVVTAFVIITTMQSQTLRAQAILLREQTVHLTAERDKATQVTQFLTDVLSSADPYQPSGHVPTLREVLDRGANRMDVSLRDRPEVRAHLLSAIAPAYFGLGDWNRAADLAAESVALRRKAGEPRDAELGAALLYLAGIQINQHTLTAAEASLREAIAIFAATDGLSRSNHISAQSTLGVLLLRQGRLTEADAVIRPLLTAERARVPMDTARVAQLSRNLAHVMRDQRAYALAVPLYEAAYNWHLALYGANHPESANSAVNLGMAYANIGNAAAAESLMRAGVTTKRALLGLRHVDVAADQLSFAAMLAEHGKQREASALRLEVRAARAAQATYVR